MRAAKQLLRLPAASQPFLQESQSARCTDACPPQPRLLLQVKTNMFVNPQLYPSPTACVRKIVEQQVGRQGNAAAWCLLPHACLSLAQSLGVSAAPAAGQLATCSRPCSLRVVLACVPSAALAPPSRSFLAGRARPFQGLGRAVGAAGPNDHCHFRGERILAQ